ncbi:MAG: hypothetical protein AAF152_05585 [Cyanobacteria bacterium P01_A01_bin.114]
MIDEDLAPFSSDDVSDDLVALAEAAQTAAQARQGDCFQLLELLRVLESLHHSIRETLFRDALPDNRQRLYQLLRDIEINGGWPYIKRMKLTTFLAALDNIVDADLPNTDLPKNDLPNTDLPNTDLPSVDLPNTDLPNTGLPNTDLPDATRE